MMEKRHCQRWKTYLGASILCDEHHPGIDCLVRNRSASGARIDIVNSTSIPRSFDFMISREGVNRTARLVWRTKGSIGIRFDETATADDDIAAADIVSIDAARLARSEATDRRRLDERIAQVIRRGDKNPM